MLRMTANDFVPPCVPTNVAMQASSWNEIDIAWDALAAPAQGTEVQYMRDDLRGWCIGALTGASTVAVSIHPHPATTSHSAGVPSSDWSIRLRFFNSAGSGAWSTAKTVTTPAKS